MAKTTVNIKFIGVGVCYKKDDKWKMLLPFEAGENKCHATNFGYQRAGGGTKIPEPLAESGRTIEIFRVGSDGNPRT